MSNFETFSNEELINYCKKNNINYFNKENKPYNHKKLLSILQNIKNIDIDAKLNDIIKSCHDKLYKASIIGFKALNDIMNIFILILLEYVFKSNPKKLDELIKIKKLKLMLKTDEINEYKSYLLDINKFISKFDEKCDFSSIWRNYILFLASLFPSLYDKDDTKFNCKEERIITDVFKTIASLTNDINDEFIDELAIKHGNIYEYFIGYCGKSENSKAFGQFFTPKPFINAILNDCGFKDMINNLEITDPTLYDPAMGSGGLLGLTYITCKDKINPNNIYGCEIEKDTMRYGESSILITTKIFNNNLIRCNTLDRKQNPYLRDNKKFNIIISNPPFGTKTNYKDLIPDEEIHNKKYKDDIYPIQTNGEKLFIQNIIYLLADGGICALILPDGELMTSNDTNKTIRKFIIDNCKIIKIIEVDNGVFKHTNIKTKVLILKKEKTTDYNYEIDYLNINKKYEVKLIQKFKLNKDYHFSIKTNYEDLIIDNKDIEIKTLGEICDMSIKGNTNTKEMSNTGEYPFYKASVTNPSGTHNTFCFDDTEYILFIKSGGNALNPLSLSHGIGKVYYVNGKTSGNSEVVKIKILNNEQISFKYLYYYLQNEQLNIQKLAKYSTNLGHIDMSKLKELKIPIPSLEIQERLIKEIEDIDILINLRKNANENLKKEKEYLYKIINKKIINNSEIKTLEEICEFQNGFQLDKKDIIEGNIPIFGGGFKIVGLHNAYNRNGNEIIICGTGAAGYVNYNFGKPFWASQCFTMKSKNINIINDKYLYYYSKIILEPHFMSIKKGTAIPFIRYTQIIDIKIPIPSLEIQEQYIKDIEELNIKFDKLKEDNNYIINNLEEYKKNLFKF